MTELVKKPFFTGYRSGQGADVDEKNILEKEEQKQTGVETFSSKARRTGVILRPKKVSNLGNLNSKYYTGFSDEEIEQHGKWIVQNIGHFKLSLLNKKLRAKVVAYAESLGTEKEKRFTNWILYGKPTKEWMGIYCSCFIVCLYIFLMRYFIFFFGFLEQMLKRYDTSENGYWSKTGYTIGLKNNNNNNSDNRPVLPEATTNKDKKEEEEMIIPDSTQKTATKLQTVAIKITCVYHPSKPSFTHKRSVENDELTDLVSKKIKLTSPEK